MRKPGRQGLTPDDWAKAALAAIARGGLNTVAVEPIAAELAATKGSFYWHFTNRDALVQAALDRWEQLWTEAVIARLEREHDPAERLKMVIAAGFETGSSDRVEVALIANSEHPAALRAVRRVAERRITYMTKQLESLGWSPRNAFDRAVLLYYVYVGFLQMEHVSSHVLGSDARKRQMHLVFETLVSPDPASLADRQQAFDAHTAGARRLTGSRRMVGIDSGAQAGRRKARRTGRLQGDRRS